MREAKQLTEQELEHIEEWLEHCKKTDEGGPGESYLGAAMQHIAWLEQQRKAK